MIAFTKWPWQFWSETRPLACAVMHEQEAISWQALANDIDKQSAIFQRQGVDERCCVALRGKNSYSLLIHYLAVLQLGAKVLPINPQMPESVLFPLLDNLNVSFIYSDGDVSEPVCWPDSVILLNNEPSSFIQHVLTRPVWSMFRPATMTLTSGSSGIPKAVVHSVSAHLENADGLLQRLSFEFNDSWLLSLPIFHVSGQSIIWRWILKGATLVIRDMANLASALENCTHSSLVPTQLWRLLSQRDLTISLKHVLLGGAAIATELTEQAQRRGINCWCGYGLTEMAATVCAKEANGLPGVGMPLPNRQMKIVSGQIYLRGAGLALGYWQNGQVVSFVDERGWFATRDRGRIENGELRILGRIDNEFFSGGEGISPEDIERILLAHPLIEQAFIVPINDEEFGHRPAAIIQSKLPISLEQVVAWLEGKVARFKLPIACYSLPEWLAQGGIKISRKHLSEWANQQFLATGADAVSKERKSERS